MAQVTIHVEAGTPVVAKLGFKGIAKYSAYLFEPAGAQWVPIRVLVENASSIDARPDVLTFEPAARGKQVLFFLTALGERLLAERRKLFRLWHRVRDGTMTRAERSRWGHQVVRRGSRAGRTP